LLLEVLGLELPDVLPIYIGDDLTDEEAFRVLQDRGLSILVEEKGRPTAALYSLKNPGEVEIFLRRFLALLQTGG